MDQFQMDHQALYHLLKIKCERETLDDVLQGMRTLLADEAMPTAEQVRTFLQAPGDGGRCPPSGGASIASGYTSVALARAEPRHPLPPGEKCRRKKRPSSPQG